MNLRIQIAALYGLLSLAITGIVLCFPWPAAGRGSCLLQGWFGPAKLLTPAEYVLPYGLIWWGSWVMLFLAVVAFRRVRTKQRTARR